MNSNMLLWGPIALDSKDKSQALLCLGLIWKLDEDLSIMSVAYEMENFSSLSGYSFSYLLTYL